MGGSQTPGSSPAELRHAQQLAELRQRILQDENIGSQLRAGGEPGMFGSSGVDDQTLLRWLKAEKCVSLSMHVLKSGSRCMPCHLTHIATVSLVLPAYCKLQSVRFVKVLRQQSGAEIEGSCYLAPGVCAAWANTGGAAVVTTKICCCSR